MVRVSHARCISSLGGPSGRKSQEPPPLRTLAPALSDAAMAGGGALPAQGPAASLAGRALTEAGARRGRRARAAGNGAGGRGQGVLFVIIAAVTTVAPAGAANGPLRVGILSALMVQLAIV
jgi:hypothetical protein